MTRGLAKALVLAGVVPLLWPAGAAAHLVTTGLGPVYDGVVHVLASPDDLIPILLVGALAGMNGPTAGRWSLFAASAAWLVAGVAAMAGATAIVRDVAWAIPIFSLLGLGVLVAIDRTLPALLVGVFAVVAGALHGASNGSGLAEAGIAWTALLGIAATVFVVLALTAAGAASIRADWMRVTLRVAGSWAAAVGLLLLGWAIRGGGA